MTSVAFESAKRHAAMNVKKSEEMLQQYQGINMLKKVAPVLFVNIIEYTAYDANALKTLILTSVVKQFASAMGPFEWDQFKKFGASTFQTFRNCRSWTNCFL